MLQIIILLAWVVVLSLDAILTYRLNKKKRELNKLLSEQNKLLLEQNGLLLDQRNWLFDAIKRANGEGATE
ncbi:hypothetical protein [Phascolarctobacterium sp.]|uniref:hypothetical protein n=1 Tax=Phascolarctobacterium sp. TaxID=2049039 RepID=UPI003868BC77